VDLEDGPDLLGPRLHDGALVGAYLRVADQAVQLTPVDLDLLGGDQLVDGQEAVALEGSEVLRGDRAGRVRAAPDDGVLAGNHHLLGPAGGVQVDDAVAGGSAGRGGHCAQTSSVIRG
jgi:hypothetical protein